MLNNNPLNSHLTQLTLTQGYSLSFLLQQLQTLSILNLGYGGRMWQTFAKIICTRDHLH